MSRLSAGRGPPLASEHRPWGPGTLAPQTPSPQSQRQSSDFLDSVCHARLLSQTFSHPIPSSKGLLGAPLKVCAPDSAERLCFCVPVSGNPQEIPTSVPSGVLGQVRSPKVLQTRTRRAEAESEVLLQEAWALILCMENLTDLSFCSTVSSWSSDLWMLYSHVSQRPRGTSLWALWIGHLPMQGPWV